MPCTQDIVCFAVGAADALAAAGALLRCTDLEVTELLRSRYRSCGMAAELLSLILLRDHRLPAGLPAGGPGAYGTGKKPAKSYPKVAALLCVQRAARPSLAGHQTGDSKTRSRCCRFQSARCSGSKASRNNQHRGKLDCSLHGYLWKTRLCLCADLVCAEWARPFVAFEQTSTSVLHTRAQSVHRAVVETFAKVCCGSLLRNMARFMSLGKQRRRSKNSSRVKVKRRKKANWPSRDLRNWSRFVA